MADVTNLGKPTQDIRTIKIDNSTIDKKKPELKIEDKSKQTLTYQPKETTTSSDKNILDNVNYLKKNLYGGTLGALTGIADVPLQETQNALQKGENIKTQKDLVKQAGKTLVKTLSPTIGSVIDTYENATSKEKKNLIQSALDSYQGIYNATSPFTGVKEALTGVGALNTGLDEKVANVREDLNRPAEEYREKLAEESQNYGKVTNMLGTGMQQVGYMVPSIAATAITKNPELGLYGVMGASAKGSSTREAELAGADLDTAIKIGNAKAAGEVLSENLTGGLNVFGKGAIDDIALKGVDKVIKNKGLNFLAKQGLGIVGEQAEEVLTDILGYMIDKGTIDPNKQYTLDDLKQTLFDTGVSTILLNTLTGGYSPKAYKQNAQLLEQNKAQEQEKIQPNINTIEQQEKAIEEPKIEQKEVIEEQPQQEIKKEENFNDYAKEKLIKMAEKQATYSKTKEDFIKRWYSKEAEQEIGISKKQLEDIYDKAKNVNISEEKVKEQVIKVKNKSGKELTLKQDKNNPTIYNKEQPKTYGKSIVPKEVIEGQLAKLKNGTKVSNFYSNITEKSKFITQENMEKLSKEDLWRYSPITNAETMEKAANKIGNTQKSVENAYGDFMTKEFNSAEDVAEGWIFLKRFQDAGNYNAMVQVIKKMKQSGTTGGQIVQAYNIMSRLTPEGMVKYAQSELMDAEKAYNKGNSKKMIDKYAKNFELTGDEVKYISDTMKKIEKMQDGREKKIELAKIQKMLQEKLPPQKGQALKAWMRISMLFNPKTQIRNLAGNELINPVNTLADVAGSAIDKLIARQTGTRTLGAPTIKSKIEYLKGAKQGAIEAWQDYKMGVDTKDLDVDRFEVGQGKAFNENNKILKPFAKVLNKTNDILGLAMGGGDRIFYQGAFNSSLYNQMKLNNVDKPTQDMIDIATAEALSRTWNDNNDYTKFVLDLRNSLNKFSTKLTGQNSYGLGDVLIPFAKTPANLTKAIYDYSPLGLASQIFETKKIKNAIQTGQITPQMQHEFAQNVGKGVAGTMLYILGYALAKAGITTGSKDDDKDVADFIRNTMGIQPYSIKIGDKSYTYDWAQPIAAPFAITADAYKNLSNKKNSDALNVFNTVVDVANTGLNVLLSQSFFSGIQEVLNNNEGVINGIQEQILSLPARAIPTFLKQVNDMIDRTQRTTYERNKPVQTAKQNAMNKVPGQSTKLAPRVDTLGREIQKYGGDKNDVSYFFKTFLSPANTSNAQTSEIASEIYKVYEETGDKTIMPRVAPYYITNKTTGTIDLSSQDRAKYQKTSGSLVSEAMVDLINNRNYQELTYDEKAQVINGVVNYADAKAKEEFTGKISTWYSSADKKISNGMAISDYYLDKVLKKRESD